MVDSEIDFQQTGPSVVMLMLTAFSISILMFLRLKQAWVFFRKSNTIKTSLMSIMSPWVYFKPFGDSTTVLSLDSPSDAVLKRRVGGYAELEKRLQPLASFHKAEPRLVDCRFKKVKVLFPLLKELERPYPNRIEAITDKGRRVSLKNAAGDTQTQLYLSCDAVRVLTETEHDALLAETTKLFAQSETRASAINLIPEMDRNMQLLQKLTGLDKFRYALSGSECVDACLKDVRISTSKKYIVRFKSAYHGHTSGVDSFSALGENHSFIYLKEMDEKSLLFIETYHYCIAGVIVNPMMFFTGVNALSPPGEKMTTGARNRPQVSRRDYAEWLHKLDAKTKYCSKYLTPMAFILDDIYFAFRVPELFSFLYFTNEKNEPLDPDMLILGKGVAGGFMPVSVSCGKKAFSMNYDPDYLMKINKVVGTLAAYPMGLIASNLFLEKLLPSPGSEELPASSDEESSSTVASEVERDGKVESATVVEMRKRNARFDKFTEAVNEKFKAQQLPLRLRNHANTFTVDFLNNSLYNSVYVQHLIANGVYVTNQSTGKFNLLADWADGSGGAEQALRELEAAFVQSAEEMQVGGFFEPKRKMRWFFLFRRFFCSFLQLNSRQIMEDKRIDIEVSHNHPVNKWTHFWSSLGMIVFAYTLILFYGRHQEGFFIFLFMHVLRQAGHFFYEKQDVDFEKLKFGHKDASKKASVVAIAVALFCFWRKREILSWLNAALGRSQAFVAFYTHFFLPVAVDFLGYWGGDSSTLSFRNAVTSRMAQNPEQFKFCNLTDQQFVVIAGLMTIMPHFIEIVHKFGWVRGIQWIIKIFSDPFTDLIDFYEYWAIHPREFLDFKKQFGTYELDFETKTVTDCETRVVQVSREAKLAKQA